VGIVVTKDSVVGRQNRTAAVTEDRVDTLVSENLHDDISTSHSRACEWVLSCASQIFLFVHAVTNSL
jgi:hypothetical protein